MTDFEREKNEAIFAGKRALDSLIEARQMLNSASNWGLLDIFGGGLISTFMKHSKMNNARGCIEKAQYELQRFNKELHDIDLASLNLNTNDFLGFADYFFDGFIADFLVQSKISDAKQQVETAIRKVQQALDYLTTI